MSGVLYRCYQQALPSHERRPVFRALVRGAAMLLARWRKVQFPERKTGGWYWIWRWRFEFLMSWLERDSVEACRALIRPGMTVIDIGAHIGYYTRLFAGLAGPRGRVIAFEPNPENFAVLRRNLAGYPQVELHALAVSDREGEVPLYVSAGHSNHSLVAGFTGAESTVAVESVTLDAFLEARGLAADFVKCDAEGAEPRVLSGMQQTLAGTRAIALLFEYNPQALEAAGVTPASLPGQLRELGFEVRQMSTGVSEESNLLCRRPQVV